MTDHDWADRRFMTGPSTWRCVRCGATVIGYERPVHTYLSSEKLVYVAANAPSGRVLADCDEQILKNVQDA